MKSSNKGSKILVFILIALVIIAGIVVGKQILQVQETNKENNIQSINTSVNTQQNQTNTTNNIVEEQTNEIVNQEPEELFSQYYDKALCWRGEQFPFLHKGAENPSLHLEKIRHKYR